MGMNEAGGIGRAFGWLSDLFHVALGAITVLITMYHDWRAGFLIAMSYITYQLVDFLLLNEDWRETVVDILEYLAGVLIGVVIVFILV